MAIILTLKESSTSLIDGIPEFLELSVDGAADIFYTLDGTEPDEESLQVDGKVFLPTIGSEVFFRAVTISGNQKSNFISKKYSTDSTNFDGPRKIAEEGISILPFGDDPVGSLSFDVDGGSAREHAIELEDLDVAASTSTRKGEKIPDDTTVSLIRKALAEDQEDDIIRSNVSDINFDPKAMVISIDGSTADNREKQVVRIMNRAHNSMDSASDFYDENMKVDEQVITGNLVKSIYNRVSGVIVYYYWDSRECRWITSKQKIDPKEFKVSSVSSSGRRGAGRLVYRWVQERAATRIF